MQDIDAKRLESVLRSAIYAIEDADNCQMGLGIVDYVYTDDYTQDPQAVANLNALKGVAERLRDHCGVLIEMLADVL